MNEYVIILDLSFDNLLWGRIVFSWANCLNTGGFSTAGDV